MSDDWPALSTFIAPFIAAVVRSAPDGGGGVVQEETTREGVKEEPGEEWSSTSVDVCRLAEVPE